MKESAKLIFYVPKDAKEKVKDAVFLAGAGKIGEYEKCSWEVCGVGQFVPSASANPTIGSANELERVEEYRVEVLINDQKEREVVEALQKAHPYECPAFEIIKVQSP